MTRLLRLVVLAVAALAMAAPPANPHESTVSPIPSDTRYRVTMFDADSEFLMIDCWTFLSDGSFHSDNFGTFGEWQLLAAGERAALFHATASIFNISAMEATGLTFASGLRLAAEGTVQFGLLGPPIPFRGFGFINPFCDRS